MKTLEQIKKELKPFKYFINIEDNQAPTKRLIFFAHNPPPIYSLFTYASENIKTLTEKSLQFEKKKNSFF